MEDLGISTCFSFTLPSGEFKRTPEEEALKGGALLGGRKSLCAELTEL